MSNDSHRFTEALAKKQRIIRAASGAEKADLVLKNAVYLNAFSGELCTGDIAIAEGVIAGLGEYEGLEERDLSGDIVLPGFIDAHIHLESSLVSPAEFARAALAHGVTTVIADPHEIANVMGADGIDYMLSACEGLPLDVYFMLPSCVPASPQDVSGAALDGRALKPYFCHPRVLGLGEMMDFAGVTQAAREPLEKILLAQSCSSRVDGHAPGLSGKALSAYVAAGMESDHECTSFESALEKLRLGQSIMIREGTAARNLGALLPLLQPRWADRCMFCSDDRYPGDLLRGGSIDRILRQAVQGGADPISAAKASGFCAARHFRLDDRGAVAPGRLADLAVIDGFPSCAVRQVYKGGKRVFDGQKVRAFPDPAVPEALAQRARDTFHVRPVDESAFRLAEPRPVIALVPGEILTRHLGWADEADPSSDRLKIAVIDRHRPTGRRGLGYLCGYGLKRGAVATSIAHDSHNIIVVGASDADMAFAVNRVIQNRGGIAVVCGGQAVAELKLPVAGLMSDLSLAQTDALLEEAKAAAHDLGAAKDIDPFMTLSFVSLPVIPKLRLTAFGMFDAEEQRYL